MREILLHTGHAAKVDDADYEWLSRFHWSRTPQGYATTYDRSVKRAVLMHRMILRAQAGQIVDHIDRDKSNNQRANLRFVTASENMRNRNPSKLPRWSGRTTPVTRYTA